MRLRRLRAVFAPRLRAVFAPDVELDDGGGGVEQEGGAGGGAGVAPPARLRAPPGRPDARGALRDRPVAPRPGVLLRQHELHEGLPEDRPALLQE